MNNIRLKRDYIATTTSDILDTMTGEVEITLSKPVESDMGWIIIEPNTVNEEQVFFHRRVGTTVFVYGVNRSNPIFHASGSTAMLTNGIDYVNYAIEQSYEQMFIYKKDVNNVIIKGGKYFFPEGNVTIPDLDTSLSLSGKTLTANSVNYVYITGGDYLITTTQNNTHYEVARITTTLGGAITQIERSKVFGIGTKGNKGDKGDTGDTGNGIASVNQISSIGLIDTYRITMTDGSHYDFTVENGADGIDGDDGVGITSVTLQSTVGKVKTYRILFTNATYFDYTVTDGNDGTGTGDMLASIYDPANGAKQIAFDDEVEHDSNKKTGMAGNESSNTFYLTAKAVYDWVVSLGYSTDSSVVHKTGNVNETITGVKTFSSSPIVPAPSGATDAVNKTYVDNLVVGLLDDRGSYDASGNTFPTTGGSGTAGAILKGDMWFISVAGTLGGVVVELGDQVRALTDSPGQTSTNWAISQANVGYVPENSANKATTMTGNTTSNTVFLTAKAIYDWATGLFAKLTGGNRFIGNQEFDGDILISGANGGAWWGKKLVMTKGLFTGNSWNIGGRTDYSEGLLFEYNDGTARQPFAVRPRGILESMYLTDTSQNKFMMGSRNAVSGVLHANQGHIYQILWGDQSGNPEGTGNDGGWGLEFGNHGNPYIKMIGNDVYIGRTDGALQIPIASKGNGKVLTSDAYGTATWQTIDSVSVAQLRSLL